MLDFLNLSERQLLESMLALPAFLPAMSCTGYAAAWLTNLHGFRQRSLVERAFWSVPLSLAVSTIASVLIGRFLSLTAVVVFFLACTLLCVAILVQEWRQLRRSGARWKIGWHPLGGKALACAAIWVAIALLSLVDIQHGQQLFANVAMVDQSFRVNWTESILRTGIPPANPLYFLSHSAPMRNYYFWYVLCAATAQLSHLPVRAVMAASSVWSGLGLIALSGLYLKHLLCVGSRLRGQLLLLIQLFLVSGLDICIITFNLFFLHEAPPADLDLWSESPVFGWLNTLLWAPHHVAGLVCCMFAFLTIWMGGRMGERKPASGIALVALALASSFGLSIYVTFAFFLIMAVWSLWQILLVHTARRALMLAAGGAGAALLLIPYLGELSHTSSGMQGGGRAPFGFAVRQMIPPDGLLTSGIFGHLEVTHPLAALNLAKLILLVPGYTIELGFFLAVLLIYLIPAWRGRVPLSSAQYTLVFIATTTIPLISLIRSEVLHFNDFGFRGALILQFCLLLLASEVVTSWKMTNRNRTGTPSCIGLPNVPRWLRSVAALALVLGVASTVSQALWARFVTSLAEWQMSGADPLRVRSFSHNAYISSIGYGHLNTTIPQDAVVQFNPKNTEPFWVAADQLGVAHQTTISGDQPWCGSELGGDPSGCIAMASAIDGLYQGQTAEQARATCRTYGIQYLIARIYDPAWNNRSSWVWTLSPVVADNEFRALDCRS
jgi:hypothetical protein